MTIIPIKQRCNAGIFLVLDAFPERLPPDCPEWTIVVNASGGCSRSIVLPFGKRADVMKLIYKMLAVAVIAQGGAFAGFIFGWCCGPLKLDMSSMQAGNTGAIAGAFLALLFSGLAVERAVAIKRNQHQIKTLRQVVASCRRRFN